MMPLIHTRSKREEVGKINLQTDRCTSILVLVRKTSRELCDKINTTVTNGASVSSISVSCQQLNMEGVVLWCEVPFQPQEQVTLWNLKASWIRKHTTTFWWAMKYHLRVVSLGLDLFSKRTMTLNILLTTGRITCDRRILLEHWKWLANLKSGP